MQLSKKSIRLFLILGFLFMVLFCVLTFCLTTVDIGNIPFENQDGSLASPLATQRLGLSSINKSFHKAFPYNDSFYKLSKIASIFMFMILALPVIYGVLDLIEAKGLKNLNRRNYVILCYLALIAILYVFFDHVVLNYRPVVMDMEEYLDAGHAAASYPSTHALLSTTIGGLGIVESLRRFKKPWLKWVSLACISVISVVVLLSRTFAGVHWLTDIVAGVLFGLSMVFLYISVSSVIDAESKEKAEASAEKGAGEE